MTIDEKQKQIVEEFSALGDGFDKYEHLIALGNRHEPLDDRFKTDAYAVSGCQSQVWIRTEVHDGRVFFQADSDSVIIKGVISLLLRTLNGHCPARIAVADLFFLKEIGLTTRLSPSRANGMATILRHMQHLSREIQGASPDER